MCILYDVIRDDSESFKDETFGYAYGVSGASILQLTSIWTFALLTLPCLRICLQPVYTFLKIDDRLVR
jgi:hypothetical protein